MSPPSQRTIFASLPGLEWLKRYRVLILVCALATPVATLVADLRSPRRYVAEATMLVKLGREFQFRPDREGGRSGSMFRLNEAINSEIEIMRSRDLARQILTELGVETVYPEIAAEHEAEKALRIAAAKLLEDLDVSGIAESSVMEARFAHADPVLSARVLSGLVRLLRARHLELFSSEGLAVYERRVDQARARLQAAEKMRSEFKNQHGLHDLGLQQELLLRRRQEISAETRQQRLSLLEILQACGMSAESTPQPGEVRRLVEALRGTGEVSIDPDRITGLGKSPQVVQAQAELLRVDLAKQSALRNYSPTSREMQVLEAEASAVRQYLGNALAREVEELNASAAALSLEQESISSDLTSLQSRNQRWGELEREVQRALESVREATARLESAAVSAAMDGEGLTSLRVIDEPSVPLEPVGLSLKIKLVLAVLVGLGIGSTSALSLTVLSQTPEPPPQPVIPKDRRASSTRDRM